MRARSPKCSGRYGSRRTEYELSQYKNPILDVQNSLGHAICEGTANLLLAETKRTDRDAGDPCYDEGIMVTVVHLPMSTGGVRE